MAGWAVDTILITQNRGAELGWLEADTQAQRKAL